MTIAYCAAAATAATDAANAGYKRPQLARLISQLCVGDAGANKLRPVRVRRPTNGQVDVWH